MADSQGGAPGAGISTRTAIIAAVGVLAVAGVGYAVWFDQKRRNDPEFRKKLSAERKKAKKQREAAQKERSETASPARAPVALPEDEPIPSSPEEREQYFMENLQKGETLFRQGPEFFEMSATAFYRAMKVYPNPMDLLVLFQRSVPEPVFNLLMEMMAADIKKKQEEYFDNFPPAEMKVKLKQSMDGGVLKRGLVALEDFEPGQVVFTEGPLVGSLDPALENDGFCSYCDKQIDKESVVPDNDFDKWVYCSEACRDKANQEYNQHLVSGPKAALSALVEHCIATNAKYPMMIARFLGRMVAEEKARAEQAEAGAEAAEETSVWEHVDKLQYMDIKPNPEDAEEAKLVTDLMAALQPGFDEFFTEERYRMLKGKLLYNAIAVQTVEPPFAPESTENIRMSEAAPTPVGAGLYHVAAYLAHSCDPSAKVEFRGGNNVLSLVAAKAIKAGDDVTVMYRPVGGIEDGAERQAALAKAFRFRCECSKCGAADGIDE